MKRSVINDVYGPIEDVKKDLQNITTEDAIIKRLNSLKFVIK